MNNGLNVCDRDFPCSPVVKTLPSNVGGAGSILGGGTTLPHAPGSKNQNKTEAILQQIQQSLKMVHIKNYF